MITLSAEAIRGKIVEKSGLSNEEVNRKIRSKMDELSGLISEAGAAHIIANELGIKLFQGNGALKIREILPGMKNIETAGKVIQKYDIREFNTGTRQGKVGNFLIADETGSIRITLWNNLTDKMSLFSVGDVVKIKNTYVRENQRGFKELHLNDNSAIVVNPPDISVEVKQREKKRIDEINEEDVDVELSAHIIDIYPPTFFEICPECNKRARLREDVYVCEAHGQVTPSLSFVVNILLDDGSGNMKCALFRRAAEQLIPNIAEFKETPSLFDTVKTELMGGRIDLSGRAVKNTMNQNLEIIGNSVKMNEFYQNEFGKTGETSSDDKNVNESWNEEKVE